MKSKTFKTPERINERIIMLFEGKEYYLRKFVKITDWAGCCPSLPSLSLCWGLGILGYCAPEKAVWSSSHQSGLPDESLTWSLRTGGNFRWGNFSSGSLNTWQHCVVCVLVPQATAPISSPPGPSPGSRSNGCTSYLHFQGWLLLLDLEDCSSSCWFPPNPEHILVNCSPMSWFRVHHVCSFKTLADKSARKMKKIDFKLLHDKTITPPAMEGRKERSCRQEDFRIADEEFPSNKKKNKNNGKEI